MKPVLYSNVPSILKKYNSIRYSLFNYWSLLLYNKYIYYFFNCFFKKGKKNIAIRLVYLLLITLKKRTMISPILVLQSALLNYRHILKLRIIKYRRKQFVSFILLSLNRQIQISIKHLSKQFSSFNLNTNKYSILEKLVVFVLNLFFKTPLVFGKYLQQIAEIHKLIDESRSKGKRKYKGRNKRKRRRRRKRYSKFKGKIKFKFLRNKKLRKKFKRQVFKIKWARMTKRQKYLFKLRIKRKRIKKHMKKVNKVHLVQRRIRKRFLLSILKPLRKKKYKRKKRKLSDYKYSILQLRSDISINSDLQLINTERVHNKYFVSNFSFKSARLFFFYINIGMWYKLLEQTYSNITSPFWHLYNLRSKFFKQKLYEHVASKKLAPDVNNLYIKHLIKFLNNKELIKTKLSNIKFNTSFTIDNELLLKHIGLYKSKVLNIYNKKKTYFKKKQNKKIDLNKSISTKKFSLLKKLYYQRSYIYPIYTNKKLLNFIRNNKRNTHLVKSKLTTILRLIFNQRYLKLKRRYLQGLIHYVHYIKQHFFILIRFRLVRLIWCALRSISERRNKFLVPRRKKGVAVRAFLIKN